MDIILLREIYVIRNLKHGNEAKVANCCVNKFLDINNANKNLVSIKGVKGNAYRTMNLEALDYLLNNHIVNKFEYDFYLSLGHKINLSYKQHLLKAKINNKFVLFASYEANSAFARVNKVLIWAQNMPWFDLDFLSFLKKVILEMEG